MNGFKTTAAIAAGCLLLAFAGGEAWAQDESGAAARKAELEKILHSQHPRRGDIHVAGTNATLHLGSRYYFLGADETKQVLVAWAIRRTTTKACWAWSCRPERPFSTGTAGPA